MLVKPKTRRLFFALWPDDETRRQIAQHIIPHLHSLNGRKVSQHQWHITLAFLGNVTDDVMQCAIEQAKQIHSAPFDIKLDVLGHWSRPKVVWLGCSNTPEPLLKLVQTLNQQLSPCGYVPEYKDYKTHMTLVRKVSRRPKEVQFDPILIQSSEFVLVESQVDNMGSTYKVIGQWKFI